MKTPILPLACLAALTLHASAAIIVPGADGSDGPLNITANTEIDLGLAPTGVWDAAGSGNGVYDPTKWAVVFKYSSVNVAAGATLTFKNNASRAPVVWLVSGDVTIAGTVSLNGQSFQAAPLLAEPGPGGFRGGVGNFGTGVGASAGFGPGGARRGIGNSIGGIGYAAGYGSAGADGSSIYGNPSIIPLVGGSGSSGPSAGNWQWAGGSGGGGAILIACSNVFELTGFIHSNGGASPNFNGDYYTFGGGASGGAVRIIANGFGGTGALAAMGSYNGGTGRIRIERVNNTATIVPTPDPSVVDLAPNATAILWPPTGAPEVKVVSVGGTNAPADPKAGFGTIGADVALPAANTTTVVVETTNVEAASVVKVRGTPRSNASYTEIDAPHPPITVSTNPLVLRWTVDLPVGTGYNAVQARVIRP